MTIQCTIDITQADSFKVVCGKCERRAEIIWREINPEGFIAVFAHIACHGVNRFVAIAQYHVRVAEMLDTGELALLWEQLSDHDLGDDPLGMIDRQLKQIAEHPERNHPELAPVADAAEQRLRNRRSAVAAYLESVKP